MGDQGEPRRSWGEATPRHVPLGSDACGYFHHHAAVDELIWVFDHATIIRVVDLNNDPGDWGDWVTAVDRERGWDDLTLGAFVAHALTGQGDRNRTIESGNTESDTNN